MGCFLFGGYGFAKERDVGTRNAVYLLLTFWLIQLRPSKRPSPVVAHDGWTYQGLSRIVWSCSFSVTSAGVMAA